MPDDVKPGREIGWASVAWDLPDAYNSVIAVMNNLAKSDI